MWIKYVKLVAKDIVHLSFWLTITGVGVFILAALIPNTVHFIQGMFK